jgi:transcriptional pleiotropic regulator of transition state genes
MKTAENVRKIDELGRIVLPKEIRRHLNIVYSDLLEIFVERDRILLKKLKPVCSLCGNDEDLIHFKGKSICSGCKSDFKLSLHR